MTRRLLLAAVFLGALTIAVGAWIVEGVRWLLGAPARAARATLTPRSSSADTEPPQVPPAARRA